MSWTWQDEQTGKNFFFFKFFLTANPTKLLFASSSPSLGETSVSSHALFPVMSCLDGHHLLAVTL